MKLHPAGGAGGVTRMSNLPDSSPTSLIDGPGRTVIDPAHFSVTANPMLTI